MIVIFQNRPAKRSPRARTLAAMRIRALIGLCLALGRCAQIYFSISLASGFVSRGFNAHK